MSSEVLGSGQDVLKGNLGGGWDIKHGYADAYTDLGMARRFGGASDAWSLRDIGAMNGRVVKVRRDSNDDEVDFTANQVQSGALEEFVQAGLDYDAFLGANFTSAGSVASFTADGKDGFTATNDSSTDGFFGVQLASTVSSSTVVYVSFMLSGTVPDGGLSLRQSTVNGTIGQSAAISGNPAVTAETSLKIGFNSVALTANATSAFISFVSDNDAEFTVSNFKAHTTSRNGFVRYWYDQSGNGVDLSQNTASNQPEIVLNGGQVKLDNGSPCIAGARRPTNQRREFDATSNDNAIPQPFTCFQIANSKRSAAGYIWGDNTTSSGGGPRLEMKNALVRQTYNGTDNPAGVTIDGDVDQVISLFSAAASGNALLRRNSTQLQSSARSTYDDTDNVGGIFRFPGDDANLQNRILLETLVFFDGDHSDDFVAVEKELAQPMGIDI